jgi:hypothetical protein
MRVGRRGHPPPCKRRGRLAKGGARENTARSRRDPSNPPPQTARIFRPVELPHFHTAADKHWRNYSGSTDGVDMDRYQYTYEKYFSYSNRTDDDHPQRPPV